MHGGTRAEKQRVRQEAQRVSAGLTEAYRREASREIARQVLDLPEWKDAGTVMAYWSKRCCCRAAWTGQGWRHFLWKIRPR